jgi:hypothetical protein
MTDRCEADGCLWYPGGLCVPWGFVCPWGFAVSSTPGLMCTLGDCAYPGASCVPGDLRLVVPRVLCVPWGLRVDPVACGNVMP